MTTTTPRSGGCQCGQIRYRIHGPARMLYACHCSDCQKQSASAFGMSLIVDREQIEISAGAESRRHWETRGDDGRIKRCTFCSRCGTRLFHGGDDARVSVKAGSLDDTRGLRPVAHIWLRSAQPWVVIDRDTTLCYEREPDDEAELERRWREQVE
jgi:hypothetical protein